MKNLFLFFVVCAFAKASAQQPTFDYASFDENESSLPYRILKPKNFSPDKQYPLHIFLHGTGEKGTDNEAQLKHASPRFLAEIEKYPAIVIFPQCPKDDSWSSGTWEQKTAHRKYTFYKDKPPTKALSQVLRLIDYMADQPYIDNTRLYIGGLSNGAMGTYELLRFRPKLFAAATPICGGAHVATISDWASETPAWIFHGSDDPIVPPTHSRDMVVALTKLGAHPKYSEYEGVRHDSWTNTFLEPELFDWIYSQQRVPEEAKNQWSFLQFTPTALLSKYNEANKAEAFAYPDGGGIVFMGDSITEGWLTTSPEYWEENPRYINRGYSGQTTAQMLLRFRQDVINLKPKAVVILAGTNDIAGNTGVTAIENTAENIFAMADLAKAHTIKVIIASVLPAADYPWKRGIAPADKIVKLNGYLHAFAKANGHSYLDLHTAMKTEDNGMKPTLTYDEVHCTKEGYTIIQPLMDKMVREVLQK